MKTKGSRMGRGKGGVKRWKFNLCSGLFLLKLLNININLLYLIVFNLERQLGGNINYN
jgi:hypothetical protein